MVPPGAYGAKTLDPRVLASFSTVAPVDGIRSARELSRVASVDMTNRWICGNEPANDHSLSGYFNCTLALIVTRLAQSGRVALARQGRNFDASGTGRSVPDHRGHLPRFGWTRRCENVRQTPKPGFRHRTSTVDMRRRRLENQRAENEQLANEGSARTQRCENRYYSKWKTPDVALEAGEMEPIVEKRLA
jgi:hypothetical protein